MGILKTEGTEVEVKDGESIIDVAEGLGVIFACQDGICGTCRITILEGEDNLTELNEKEEVLGGNKQVRFACQCRIKQGTVRIQV